MSENQTSRRVLVVEDNEGIRDLTVEMLARLGHESIAVATLEEAVAQARGEQFDLMLIDYRLPDGDGVEVLKQISKERPVRAVLMSAYDEQSLELHLEAGFMAVLSKPIDMDRLNQTIDDVCARPLPGG